MSQTFKTGILNGRSMHFTNASRPSLGDCNTSIESWDKTPSTFRCTTRIKSTAIVSHIILHMKHLLNFMDVPHPRVLMLRKDNMNAVICKNFSESVKNKGEVGENIKTNVPRSHSQTTASKPYFVGCAAFLKRNLNRKYFGIAAVVVTQLVCTVSLLPASNWKEYFLQFGILGET